MDQDAIKTRLREMVIEKSFRYRDDPPFTLASGKTSTYYFNCKPTTLDPEGMNLVGAVLFDMVADRDITAAGGLTLGADPLANALSIISWQRGRPIKSFVVRKDAKSHGTQSALEGNVEAGERVIVLDDVITTGGSTIQAIHRVREAGLVVDSVIAFIDREEGGKQAIEAFVPDVRAIFSRTEIMDYYTRMKKA
ncbi:MAG: orotate phosphoribosyltransferase [Syntrophales bacterium]|jgi:orotate phosphoribosyltransferase|nr:orotate phosphoribosyltransferase [Syntrophales bacterium]MCK9527475.1 orotate phosphoribosyltransferase [Syntrophales bacterium]MDX9922531.1 orotate phosphoribosyltransferase [Syntrophales bacterium]